MLEEFDKTIRNFVHVTRIFPARTTLLQGRKIEMSDIDRHDLRPRKA